MKKTTLRSENRNVIKAFIIGVLFFYLMINNGFSQSKRPEFGISLTSSVSGIGFGTQYSPGVFITKGKKHFEAGVIVQKRNFNMTGFRANYQYTVFNGSDAIQNERLELFFFADAVYHNNARLGSCQIRMEKLVKPESEVKFPEIKFKAVESYAGFGLRIKLTNKFKWCNSIGMGGWYTISGEKRLDREANAFGIMFRTKLTYQF